MKMKLQESDKGVVIIDKHAISYGLIRSIAEFEIPIVLIYFETLSICRFSKYISKAIRASFVEPEDIPTQLIEISKAHALTNYLLIPCEDIVLEQCSKNQNVLSKYFVTSFPEWSTLSIYLNKRLSYHLVEKLKIPFPQIFHIDRFGESQPSFGKIPFPVIVKPDYNYYFLQKHKAKSILCDNVQSLLENIQERSSEKYNLLVQRFIKGGTDVLYSFGGVSINGKIIRGLSYKRLRQHPKDFGTTTSFEIYEVPILRKYSEFIIQANHYTGPFEIEYMFDKEIEKYVFIEINPRFWGGHTIFNASGNDIISVLINNFLDIGVKPNNNKEWDSWQHILTDFFIVFTKNRNSHSIKHFFSSLSKSWHPIFNRKDILPFIVEIIKSPIEYLERRKS